MLKSLSTDTSALPGKKADQVFSHKVGEMRRRNISKCQLCVSIWKDEMAWEVGRHEFGDSKNTHFRVPEGARSQFEEIGFLPS